MRIIIIDDEPLVLQGEANLIRRIEPGAEVHAFGSPLTALKQMPAVETDGRVYVGGVEIPSLGLTLPVLSEWSYANLKIAPCRYAGSCYTDDLVLCAHNYRSHFNALRWVDMGEEVYFTTADGESFRYVIVNRETLDPDETEYLTDPAADWDLTLFTCYVGGATRCVIRCERAD